jgi:hypothetical protein
MADTNKSLVVVLADWVVEEVGGKSFGMCRIKWAPPFDRFDFERGFVLPQPSCARVAAQALVLAIEAVEGAAFIDPKATDVAIGTKNKLLHDMLTDPNKALRWCDTGRWPKGHASLRVLVVKCLEGLLRLSKYVSIVFIEREDGDDPVVELDKYRTEDGFDMEGMSKRGATPEELEKALQETRMRGVMAQKLLASDARCYRPKAR